MNTVEDKQQRFSSDNELGNHTVVNAMKLEKRDFAIETLSQGHLQAASTVDIDFPFPGKIQGVFVSTGQYVQKGTLIAQLDDFELKNAYQEVREEIAKASLSIESKLISLGYTKKDTAVIPKELWNNIQVGAGLPILKLRAEKALHKLNQAKIVAPISGVVANLEAEGFNSTSKYKRVCTIINNSKLQVKFPILESEIEKVQIGNTVRIAPLHNKAKSYFASISGINPEVNDNGTIWIYATLKQRNPHLLSGMKVNVTIMQQLSLQLVVPKSAVVDRQDRLVVFIYKNGKSHWKYIQILNENATHYAIENNGAEIGDTIIIDNNFDLAHLENVQLDSVFSY